MTRENAENLTSAPSTGLPADNPFATPWTLPYGLPDFAAVRAEHILPAVRAGVAEQRAILARVAEVAEPSFDSVVEPLISGSPLLTRVTRVYFHLMGADGTEELAALEAEVSGLLAELSDATFLDARLFAQVDAVRDAPGELTDEQAHILGQLHRRFVLHGARLDEAGRAQLAALNQRIVQLETSFTQVTKRDMKAASVLVADDAELAGLDEEQISRARAAAQEVGQDGFLLGLTLPTVQGMLASLQVRSTRERLYTASVERGEETWTLAAQIAAARAEKAQLLGFADFASLAVADRTARTPEAVEALFARTVPAAMRNVEREAQRITARAQADGLQEIAPWDWAYYENLIRAEEFAVDESVLRPYFVLDRVLTDGVFRAAHEVYGLSFEERPDLRAHHETARIWEVFDADGSGLGLFIGDYFTRDTKRGGAWMNALQVASRRDGTSPVVANTMNVTPPAPGRPALVSLDEARTMFHEFGHALHALLSDVENASVSGTSVPRDMVEFPSQVNEMWQLRPGIVEQYARHVDTGEQIPAALLEGITASAPWGEGFATAEYLAAAVLDWRWHRLTSTAPVEDPRAFEAQQLAESGLTHPLVAPRYRTGYFQHTFSGSYASGYYAYLWAEEFDADSVAWYEEQLAAGVPLREAGDAFRRGVLAIGGSRDLLEAYTAFRGRDRDARYLLERRGLV